MISTSDVSNSGRRGGARSLKKIESTFLASMAAPIEQIPVPRSTYLLTRAGAGEGAAELDAKLYNMQVDIVKFVAMNNFSDGNTVNIYRAITKLRTDEALRSSCPTNEMRVEANREADVEAIDEAQCEADAWDWAAAQVELEHVDTHDSSIIV